MKFTLALAVLSAAISSEAAAIAQREFPYYTGGVRVKTANISEPVTFNGVIIHTAELNASDITTTFALTDGHHFGHYGWMLTDGPGSEGPQWKYLEHSSTSPKLAKRQSDVFTALDFITDTGSALSVATDTTVGSLTDIPFMSEFGFFAATEINWDSSLDFAIDFFLDGDFVAGTEALEGVLSGFFATSWELFLL